MAAGSWRRDRPTRSSGNRSIHIRKPWRQLSRMSRRTKGSCRRCSRRSKLRQEKMVARSERGARAQSNDAGPNARYCTRFRPDARFPVTARVRTRPDPELALRCSSRSRQCDRQPTAFSRPFAAKRARIDSTSARGVAANSVFVYSCCGSENTASRVPYSTASPKYITMTSSAM